MIQRIQTVYLLVVAILMVIMMSSNIGHFYTDDSVISMSNLAVEQAEGVNDYTSWALYAILYRIGCLCMGRIEILRQLYSGMVDLCSSYLYYIGVVGYPCDRKRRNAG